MSDSFDTGLEAQMTECPSCGSTGVTTTMKSDSFPYGERGSEVVLSADVPVHQCRNCEMSFLGEEASRIRHEAVCRHLDVLTPRQIRSIRENYGMSQADFAEITRIGKASLARWEAGQLIQNPANDNLLRLMMHSDNFFRMQERVKQGQQQTATSPKKFRCLEEAELGSLRVKQSKFELYLEGA